MTDRPLPQLSIKEQRERTIELLCDHFAQDRLELSEFEARLDSAHRASTAVELQQLLSDLPARATPHPEAPRTGELLSRGARVLRDEIRDSRTLLAIMGGVERSGAWAPARRNLSIAVMGGIELDFRDTPLPPGQTEVVLFCLMGGAHIIVPPDLAVDATGLAVMGAFAHEAPPLQTAAAAPLLRIRGFCLMGGVEIEVRERGESARAAKQRRKQERRGSRRPDGRE